MYSSNREGRSHFSAISLFDWEISKNGMNISNSSTTLVIEKAELCGVNKALILE